MQASVSILDTVSALSLKEIGSKITSIEHVEEQLFDGIGLQSLGQIFAEGGLLKLSSLIL